MNRILLLCLIILGALASLHADEARILELTGRTMGTRYVVKVFDPPESDAADFSRDMQLEIDTLLRRVNDQMSTYLKSSEVSRFNQTDSTQWFDVSVETATVVQFAQDVARKTDGAFDVTVGPLVNAWSFGPDPRTNEVPDPALLDQLKQSVGFEKLMVRMDPPALRKSNPKLKVDLSAIAKGHGVDRVVSLLNDAGAQNVFVEIGGEVRTSGSKAGQWWKVGIQLPDADRNEVLIAHAMNTGAGNDQSMATSGDYRNYFEVADTRYSHTIDPRTAQPIDHSVASVSVVSESCMAADAWATALNVLGKDEGLKVAIRERLDVLLIVRDANGFELAGTGALEQYARPSESADQPQDAENLSAEVGGNNPLVVLAITFVAFAVALFAMAIGVLFGRRAISGSCGGLANSRNNDGSVSCSLCSNPDDACKELRQRMQQETQV
jgi:thiamine biosynthesis lipoprotein